MVYGSLERNFKLFQIQKRHIVQNNVDISIKIVLLFNAFIADIDKTEFYFFYEYYETITDRFTVLYYDIH